MILCKSACNNVSGGVSQKKKTTPMQINKFPEVESVASIREFLMCKSCGERDQIVVKTVQLRSADEGSTQICSCLICNASWKL